MGPTNSSDSWKIKSQAASSLTDVDCFLHVTYHYACCHKRHGENGGKPHITTSRFQVTDISLRFEASRVILRFSRTFCGRTDITVMHSLSSAMRGIARL
jgi:hypothetical protein